MTSHGRIYNQKRYSKLLLSQVPAAARLVFATDWTLYLPPDGADPLAASCTALGYVLQAVRESGNHNRAAELWYRSAFDVPLRKLKHHPNARPLNERQVVILMECFGRTGTYPALLVDRRNRVIDGGHWMEALRRLRVEKVRCIHPRRYGDTMKILWSAAVKAGHRYAKGRHAADYRRVGMELLSLAAPAWGLTAGAPANMVGDRILEQLEKSRKG